MKPDKLSSMIGLSRRAGKAILGVPLVCLALRKNPKPFVVLASEDASEGTKKRLTTKCSYYKIPLIFIPLSTSLLAHAVGKGGDLAAIAVMDENLTKAILSAAELTGKDGAE